MNGIIGINAYHGDASAAFVGDGRLIAAAEEERFNRIKHCAGFPEHALRYVMEAAGTPSDAGILAMARDPWARFFHKARYALQMPRAALNRIRAQHRFVTIADRVAQTLGIQSRAIEVHRVEHHTAHLASSFFVSPFDQAALFSIDGMGDFASSMWGVGYGNRIGSLGAVAFPHSLGLYYTALTQFLGFPKYGDEYKVMGLGSYGEPEYLDLMREIVRTSENSGMNFELNPDYFTHCQSGVQTLWETGEPAVGRLFSDLLIKRLGSVRAPDDPINSRHRNIACSMQRRLDEVIVGCLRTLQRTTRLRKLCLAGGVAFNCVTNAKILEQTDFEEVYIQSAAGDAGLAIGAAMYVWHQVLDQPRSWSMEHSYWGPEFCESEMRAAIRARREDLERANCQVCNLSDEDQLCRVTAAEIAKGKVVGWFQGRMEWGPRALGNRSILGDPRRADMRDILNLKIKRREPFRPFAPSILEEATGEYFTQSHPSPFMLMAYEVRPEKRCKIPATTHVDGTGRLQTVNQRQNPRYYKLIGEFRRQTGVPVLLNTSFNENEPVACRPEEALDCFLRTKMDVLVMGDFVIRRGLSNATEYLVE
ncbi:MAG TPA: carbamoyltransferase C-terminal domain-containing protein [Candidatus Binataceae bacterium]|nr:carbamoyltransferase C-terminal domain-containing protein [Candidatus Binataceae bacterium]